MTDPLLGLDPFDALRGTRVPGFVRRNPRLRQLAIQLRKRSPIDLAPLYGVTPFKMAKTAGCLLSAESRLLRAGHADAEGRSEELEAALRDDRTLARSEGGGWGYEFDVQTRWAFYPAGSPNVIATYFVGRGLLERWLVSGSEWALSAATEAAHFVWRNLVSERGHVCYTPDNQTLVHNANVLGAGLISSVGRLIGHDQMVADGARAAELTVAALDADGLWPYGESSRLSWVDNFHTAYTLDGLLLVSLASGGSPLESTLSRGHRGWTEHFFAPDGRPYYFSDKSGPVDIHSAATAIDVGVRMASAGFASAGLSETVATWTRQHLVAPDGTTYYQVRGGITDRRHFRRWGDAHWALATSSLELAATGSLPLLEEALLNVAK